MTTKKKLRRPRKPSKHKNKFVAAVNLLSYIILLVVLGLLAFVIISNKFSSKVPVIGGYSYLKVATGSMIPTIPVGTTILIKTKPFDELEAPELDENGNFVNYIEYEKTNTSTNTIEKRRVPTDGDVISFYAYISSGSQKIVDGSIFTNRKKFKRVIITHRIYKIEEINGVRYINTKGDNPFTNDSPDTIQTQDPETKKPTLQPLRIAEKDYIGSWQPDAPKPIMRALSFVSHPLGMVLLVIIPLSIILLIDLGEYKGVKKKKESLPPPRPKKPPKRLP